MSDITLNSFLAAFYPDENEEIRLRAFKSKDAKLTFYNHPLVFKTTRARIANDPVFQGDLKKANEQRGIYFVVNAGGDSDDEITRFNAWFAESDTGSIEEQHQAFDQVPLLPSIRVETRKSVHAYWLIKGPCSEAQWRDMQSRLIAYFKGDEKIKNPSRLMRLPFFNHVYFNTKRRALEYQRVNLKEFAPERSYTFEEMDKVFPPVEPAGSVSPQPNSAISCAGDPSFATWEDLNAELKRRIMAAGRQNRRGVYETRGICHNGTGQTALMFDPATGAVHCNKGCEYTSILRAFGLPEKATSVPDLITSSAYSASSSLQPEIAFPELSEKALYGLAGDIVRLIEPHSESHPAALLMQTLVAFGNSIGRNAHFKAEADRHYLNLFTVLVGASSRSRKGTSWGQVARFFRAVDEEWMSKCVLNGLSSGEGLIWSVRDAVEKQEAIRERGRIVDYQTNIVDSGVDDKRLLVMEAEFAKVLRVMTRQGNTLSAVIREAWDSGNLHVMTRNNPAHATGAHISIIGHITEFELRRNLQETEAANGFANRILWTSTHRTKLLPEGGNLTDRECNASIISLQHAISEARLVGELKRDEAARKRWHEIYEDLSKGQVGLVGAVTSRAEAQVMRLACLYALLDCSSVIRIEHLEAGFALWKYCEASARLIFGHAPGDSTGNEILNALRGAGYDGLTQSQINDAFSGHKSSDEINRALTLLLEMGLVTFRTEQTKGRPVRRWFAATFVAKEAEKAEEPATEETYSSYSASFAEDVEPEKEKHVTGSEETQREVIEL